MHLNKKDLVEQRPAIFLIYCYLKIPVNQFSFSPHARIGYIYSFNNVLKKQHFSWDN